MNRAPNAITLAEVRADVLDWFWREVSFMKPWKVQADAALLAELEQCVPPGDDLPAACVLQIQGWANGIAGVRGADWPWGRDTEHEVAELAALDGAPMVVDQFRHWVRLRWPDGRVETVNKEKARQLGVIETTAATGRGEGEPA